MHSSCYFAGPEVDGSCVDIVRVRDRGSTLFEFCGTAAGIRVESNTNLLTLDFVANKRLYSARGFLLHYQGTKKKKKETRKERTVYSNLYDSKNRLINLAKLNWKQTHSIRLS